MHKIMDVDIGGLLVAPDVIAFPTPSHSKRSAELSRPLTALQVKRHNVGILSDAAPHQGLRLRANKNGSKTWTYRYRIAGKLKQLKLGSFPAMTLAEARGALLTQKKLREENLDPRRVAANKRLEAELANFTFAQMVDLYLVERIEKDRTPKGAAETRRLFEYDMGKLASRLVEDVKPVEIHNHMLAIADRAPRLALAFRAELSRAWRYASNTGRLSIPCPINSDTGGKLRQGKRERFLSTAELQLLLPWMDNYSDTVADALRLTLYLGLRSGEVCKLRDAWVEEEQDGWWLTIPASKMKKQHSDHRVPLVGSALAVAKKRSGCGYWFPSRVYSYIGQKVLGVEIYKYSGRSSANRYKNKILCPVTNWAANDLRKTARTHLAALGCPFEVAEAILHHKLPGVGGLYNRHSYENEKREWLAKLGELLDGLGRRGKI